MITYAEDYQRQALELWLMCEDKTKDEIILSTIGRDINKSDILVGYGSQCVQEKAYQEWMLQFTDLEVAWKDKK